MYLSRNKWQFLFSSSYSYRTSFVLHSKSIHTFQWTYQTWSHVGLRSLWNNGNCLYTELNGQSKKVLQLAGCRGLFLRDQSWIADMKFVLGPILQGLNLKSKKLTWYWESFTTKDFFQNFSTKKVKKSARINESFGLWNLFLSGVK